MQRVLPVYVIENDDVTGGTMKCTNFSLGVLKRCRHGNLFNTFISFLHNDVVRIDFKTRRGVYFLQFKSLSDSESAPQTPLSLIV